jgi:hypothetical protein
MESTGKKAKTLRELRDLIAIISVESIYHHTYQYYLKRQFLEYSNDFAHWAGESLEERTLSEYFSNIDPFLFKDVNDLRKALLKVIDNYLEQFPEPREAVVGDEFYFNFFSQSFVVFRFLTGFAPFYDISRFHQKGRNIRPAPIDHYVAVPDHLPGLST